MRKDPRSARNIDQPWGAGGLNYVKATKSGEPEFDLECMRLRGQGKSYGEIGRIMGCATGKAHESVKRQLERCRVELVEEAAGVRAMENARLDKMILNLNNLIEEIIEDPALTASEKAAAIVPMNNSMLKTQERRAKLLGLDAPTRVEQTNISLEDVLGAAIDVTPVEPLVIKEQDDR